MNEIARALGRALVSQFHPRMLWLAIWPFLVALVVWGLIGFFFRGAAIDSLARAAGESTLGSWMEAGFASFGVSGGLVVLVSFVYIALIFALMVLTALLIIATIAMPAVVEHIAGRDYPALARKHGGTQLGAIGNALWISVVFVIGFVLTIPLWLFAPFALLVPLLWWGWATARMFRYDALAIHASSEERATLFSRHGKAFFAIGTIVSLLNFVPLMFFIVPILGGLAFTHYGLRALERLRAERGESGVGRDIGRSVVIDEHGSIV